MNAEYRKRQLIAALDAGDLSNIRCLVANYPIENLSGEDMFLLGRAAYSMQEWQEAESLLQAAWKETLPDWCRGAVASTLALLYQKMGECEKALPYYHKSLNYKTIDSGAVEEYSNYLFHLHYLSHNQGVLKQAATEYQRLLSSIKPMKHHSSKTKAIRKIRVGYVSPDFYRHIVAFFAYALLKKYDRQCFQIYAYTNCQEDEATAEFRSMVDEFRNVNGLSCDEIARLIKKDNIDILVDLSGHTAGNMLPVFAYKPAPIQISGIGYFDTTGLKTMDYFLTDKYTTQPKEKENFYENLIVLPHSHLCYMWHDNPPNVSPLPCLKNGYITFGCCNNWPKINDKVLALWKEILARVPNSCLFLKTAAFDIPYVKKLAQAKLIAAGIDLSRVRLEGFSPDYLPVYQEIDIALDTFPYPGGGVTCDALYMGVPVITLAGKRHHERFGASLLYNVGLSKCVAESAAAYVDKAVALADSHMLLAEIRRTLRRKMRQSPIMDANRYMFDLEQVYHRLYQQQRSFSEKDLKRQFAEAFQAQRWQKVVQIGTILWINEQSRRQLAPAIGKAYIYLQDADRAKIYLECAPKESLAEIADNAWLLGTIENNLDHHAEACLAFGQARKAYNALRAEKKKDQAKERGEIWAQDGYEADILTQHAVNEMSVGFIAEAVRDYHEASEKAITFRDKCEMFSAYLMTCHNWEFFLQDLCKRHCEYNQLFRDIYRYDHTHSHERGHKKLRIGYISPDFRKHVMFYFYYAMYLQSNRNDFVIYSYYLGYRQDGFTELVKEHSDVWRVMTDVSYDVVARQIYADEIDILVDLAGHSVRSGLPVLAYKPAPVQISGLGYMSTTGLQEVDYLLTDHICDPHDRLRQITEKPLYLTSMFCFIGRSDVPAPCDAPLVKNGYITFGVFNRYQKITDEQLKLWQRIQAQIPNSRWYFKSAAFADGLLEDWAYERMQYLGFDMNYVTLEPASDNYMECYQKVDIALDTYPYTGGGTTCDALYMGVPVITLFGQARSTRFSASILQAAGLGELAVDNPEAYVKLVLNLAGDEEMVNNLHRNLREMLFKSSLMDVQGYMQELETHYRHIWQIFEEEAYDRLSKND